eukprot:350436-Chlamydomonas_euryale.AAC.14
MPNSAPSQGKQLEVCVDGYAGATQERASCIARVAGGTMGQKKLVDACMCGYTRALNPGSPGREHCLDTYHACHAAVSRSLLP